MKSKRPTLIRDRWRAAFTAILTIVSGVLPLERRDGATARAQFASQRQFTPEERNKLTNGELVVRHMEQRRGAFDLIGGSSWQVINARPDVVWRALLDTRYYHRTLPRVIEANLIKDQGAQRIVFIRQGTNIIQTAYYLKLTVRPERKELDFCLDESLPHSLRAGWGFFAVRPFPGGKSVLAYGVMTDVGEGILFDLVRGTARDWLLKVPWLMKRFVEGRGRWIYR